MSSRATVPLGARGRSLGALGMVLSGGAALLASTQTWLTVARTDATEPILVSGSEAVPLLAPLSLTVLALGAALSLVGLVLRYIFAVLGLIIALSMGWASAQLALAPPIDAVSAAVTAVTGVAGADAVRDAVHEISATAWPALAAACWVLLAVVAVFVLRTAASWRSGGRRFRTSGEGHDPAEATLDAIDSWDELSQGSDPTGGHR